MNPLVRWVKKIIQFFRPASAPAPVAETKAAAPVAAVTAPAARTPDPVQTPEKKTVTETKVSIPTSPEIIPSKPAEPAVVAKEKAASPEPTLPEPAKPSVPPSGTGPSIPLHSAQDDKASKEVVATTTSVSTPPVEKATEAAPVSTLKISEIAAAVPSGGSPAVEAKAEPLSKVSEPPAKPKEEVAPLKPVVLEPAESIVPDKATPSLPPSSAREDQTVKEEIKSSASVSASPAEKEPETSPASFLKISEVAAAVPSGGSPAVEAKAEPLSKVSEPPAKPKEEVAPLKPVVPEPAAPAIPNKADPSFPSHSTQKDEPTKEEPASPIFIPAPPVDKDPEATPVSSPKISGVAAAVPAAVQPSVTPSQDEGLSDKISSSSPKNTEPPASESKPSAPAVSTEKETVAVKPFSPPPRTPPLESAPSPFPNSVNLENLVIPSFSPPLTAKPEEKKPAQPVFTGRVEHTPDLDKPARLRQNKGMISVHDIANRELLDLVPYEPGKPVDDVARELGLDPASIIKLASNENPLGPSPLAMAAMRDAVDKVHFYPDGGGFHLRNAIAKAFNLGRENVVLGNGSNEIIELLFHTFTRPGIHEIVTARHAFAVYTLMAQLFGVHAIVVDDVDFTPDLNAMLRAITPQTRLVFLASPNNPTGTRVTNEALEAFLRDLPTHVIAVLDEAYYEFLDNPPDTVGQVRAGAQVVLMRTFSKIQGLAGLRIGYGLAPLEIADLLQRARQPFNANSIAQAGAMAGLADLDHQRKTKAITDDGRRLIEEAFAKMGLKYIPSSANFILVHVGDGGEVFKRLMKKGIIVRSMVSYHLPEYIRVSIGTPEQNARFLAELSGALEGLVKINAP